MEVQMVPGPWSAVSMELLLEVSSPTLQSNVAPVAVGDNAVPEPLISQPFVVTSGRAPSVTLDGLPAETTPTRCSPSGIDGEQLCSELDVSLQPGISPGMHTIAVTSISGCMAGDQFVVHPPP